MNYSQFIIKMKENLQEKLGMQVKVETIDVPKNNGIVLQGITIRRPGERIVPTIYLESFYEDYLEGRDLEDILEDFIEIYEEQETECFPDFDFYQDYEKVKKKLAVKLINKKKNKKMLAEMPYMDYLDMAIVFYCFVERGVPGTAAILVKNAHMEKWGVSLEKLYEDALSNAESILPGRIRTMEELLSKLLLEEDVPKWEWPGKEQGDFPKLEGFAEENAEPGGTPLLVLTNEKRYLGASCILYRGLLEKFAKSLGGNFYILPSSVHEVILLPENRIKSAENLLQVVMDVNRMQLAPEEVLSDTVYYYDRETGKISIYDKKQQN
ncbi:hypothetical protein D7X98_11190 [bacterium 1XD8-76]|nr:hypothetical protein D7X98_11190 [bacterium 1XD8-76]